MFALAVLTLAIWLWLAFAHGGFWRVVLPPSAPEPARWPTVRAIVPARDEAAVIERSIRALVAQDYPGPFSVILVDDHSGDATVELAQSAASPAATSGRGAPLTVVAARSLPEGWSGKVWAQSEGVQSLGGQYADSDFLWLTDADIEHRPGVLRGLVARAEAEGRDLVSLMVRLRCASLAERALIPAFVFFFGLLYPFSWVNQRHHRSAAAAGGCMLLRAGALRRIGGLAAIKDALIDDCALAAKIKLGGSIRLDLAQESISIRPYDTWGSLWNMIARSAFTQLRYSSVILVGTILGLVLVYLAPPLVALAGGGQAWPAWLAWALMTALYVPMVRYYRLNLLWSLALPAVAVFYLGATLESARRYWAGLGGQWKGRTQAPRKSSP